jgi:hypothetical protein
LLPPTPAADKITVLETLALLDGDFSSLAEGVENGEYALWLGSGISRGRIAGLDGVLQKLIEFLRVRVGADPDCPYRLALDQVIALGAPSEAEQAAIDYAVESATWAGFDKILIRLSQVYSRVLSVVVEGHGPDFLLWEGTDFTNTFADEIPDVEHLAIGILALEGVVTELASANWDGLLEAGVRDLGHGLNFYRVCVTGDDFRGPAASAKLYKFHGCALRAIAEEAEYRPLLIAREGQIALWIGVQRFEMMRQELIGIASRERTLMVGLSAQDANIRQLFVQARGRHPWQWNNDPAPHIFAEDHLKEDQRLLLEISYGDDYQANRVEIGRRSHIRAFGKPLLTALVLHVMAAKLIAMMRTADAPQISEDDRREVESGIRHLRDLAGRVSDANPLAFMRRLPKQAARAKVQLQQGSSPAGPIAYIPLSSRGVHQIAADANLVPTGQREAAAGLGLLGLGERDGDWSLSADDPDDPRSGAMRVRSVNGEARVVFVANSHHAVRLEREGVYSEDDGDIILVHSEDIIVPQQRSPSAKLRGGQPTARHVEMGHLLRTAANAHELRAQFRQGMAL